MKRNSWQFFQFLPIHTVTDRFQNCLMDFQFIICCYFHLLQKRYSNYIQTMQKRKKSNSTQKKMSRSNRCLFCRFTFLIPLILSWWHWNHLIIIHHWMILFMECFSIILMHINLFVDFSITAIIYKTRTSNVFRFIYIFHFAKSINSTDITWQAKSQNKRSSID